MPNREILASPDIAESEEGAVLLNSGYTALGKSWLGAAASSSQRRSWTAAISRRTVVEDLTAPIEYAGDA